MRVSSDEKAMSLDQKTLLTLCLKPYIYIEFTQFMLFNVRVSFE